MKSLNSPCDPEGIRSVSGNFATDGKMTRSESSEKLTNSLEYKSEQKTEAAVNAWDVAKSISRRKIMHMQRGKEAMQQRAIQRL